MHSFARFFAGTAVMLTVVQLCAQPDPAMSSAGVQTPKSVAAARYEGLLEQASRISQSTESTTDDFRLVINRFWSFVRRYPTSGFADNALWQAASLSSDAFQRFSQDRDKYRAVQLFQWLRDQYPHSPLQARAAAQIEQLETIAAAAAPETTPAAPETTIRAVHRDVLPDVVRVTLELDREVPFYQERLEGPARLFFDLKGTKTVAALVDATFRYDSDIVRHIRLGRHPNSTTRVVLDLENVGRYSVFTLYNPYRIVLDAERSATAPILQASSRPVVDPETAGTHATPAVTAPQTTSTRPIAGRTAAANPITSSDQRAAPTHPTHLSHLSHPTHLLQRLPANPCPLRQTRAASSRSLASWALECHAS